MWDLPRPGLEPVSPALAGRFSATAPPGKPHCFVSDKGVWSKTLESMLLFSFPFLFHHNITLMLQPHDPFPLFPYPSACTIRQREHSHRAGAKSTLGVTNTHTFPWKPDRTASLPEPTVLNHHFNRRPEGDLNKKSGFTLPTRRHESETQGNWVSFRFDLWFLSTMRKLMYLFFPDLEILSHHLTPIWNT